MKKTKQFLTGIVAAMLLIAQISPASASTASVSFGGLLGVAALDDQPALAAVAPATADLAMAQTEATTSAAATSLVDSALLFDAASLAIEIADAQAGAFNGVDHGDDSIDVVAVDDLGAMIGAAGFPMNVLTDQTLTAVNSGNQITATQVGSGQITLDPNAFTGFSGIANFVINSGHNNNLQSSLSVNIVITQ